MTGNPNPSHDADFSPSIKLASEHGDALDRLLQLYGRMESLLAAYASRIAEGHLATELLTTLRQLAERAGETLSALSAVKSASAEPAPAVAGDLAAKKQQVLDVLSRILQCLVVAEQRTRELCTSLRPQTEALCQASCLHRAYELALATCTESRPASSDSSTTADNATHWAPRDTGH